MSITVYSKSPCVQCDATKRTLKKKGIEYTEVTLDEALIEQFKEERLMQAPIVDIDGKRHSGFRPDLLDEIVVK